MKDINLIDRKCEVPESGTLCDLLWADPVVSDQGNFTEKDDGTEYAKNTRRGCSYIFGYLL